MEDQSNAAGVEVQGDTDTGASASGQQASWLDAIPEDVRGSELFGQFREKSPLDLYNAFADLHDKSGRAIFVPGENATEEEMKAFYAQMGKVLGVPEKIEDYGLKVPEGVPADDPLVAAIVETAHKNGLNPAQLQAVIDGGFQKIIEVRTKAREESLATLTSHFGDKFPAAQESAMKGWQGLAKKAGVDPAEAQEFFEKTGWGDSPILFKMLAEAGKYFSQDEMVEGGATGGRQIEYTKSGHPILNYEQSPDMKK